MAGKGKPATSGLFCRLTPFARRTRVVCFQRPDRTELVLFWGKRRVGRFDPERRAWVIRRPFKIFVDEKKIQTLTQVTLKP